MVTLTDINFELARRSFIHFLNYVYIQKVSDGNELGGKIKFEKWPHLIALAEDLQNFRLIVWLKARQLGCSWLIAAFNLWTAMYHNGSRIVQFAEKEDKAKELLRKCKFIYRYLPEELQEPVKSLDNQLIMEFPGVESDITCMPSTEDAAIGLTATRVWFDEFDFHDLGGPALDATMPLVNDTGGQVILTSTSNPKSAVEGSAFKSIFVGAESKGWHPIFFGWDARPDRDQQWYDTMKAAANDEFEFEKHYPVSAEQALEPPGTLIVFKRDVLNDMKLDCRRPVMTKNLSQIYQKYVNHKRYVAGTDVAHGTGDDYTVLVILDCLTGLVVADWMDNLVSPEDFCDEAMNLLEDYKWPLWGIEDNDWGRSVIGRAVLKEYPNLYYQKEEQPGWHTGPNTRWPMWSELIEGIHTRSITIPNEKGLDQFYTVIRNPKKNGRPEHQEGRNDDYCMALGIAWQLRKEQNVYSSANSQPVTINRWFNVRAKTNRSFRR